MDTGKVHEPRDRKSSKEPPAKSSAQRDEGRSALHALNDGRVGEFPEPEAS